MQRNVESSAMFFSKHSIHLYAALGYR